MNDRKEYLILEKDGQGSEFMSRLLKFLLLPVIFALFLSMTLNVGVVKAEHVIVLDSSSPKPKQVGIFSNLREGVARVFFDFGGDTIVIRLLRNGYTRQALDFESRDCSGDALITFSDSMLPRRSRVNSPAVDNPGNTLYLAKLGSQAPRITASRLRSDGTCDPSFTRTIRDTSIMEAVVDLDDVFKLPFNIVIDAPSFPLP